MVTAFMLGLGFGSLIGGWISKRCNIKPLLLLGVIELLTGAFGLVSLAIFEQVGHLVRDLPLVGMAAINLLLVLTPTLLMGATLPILVSYLARNSGRIGSAVGTLYFVNTLGAGAACIVCATVIFPFLGMHAAVWTAAGINIIVGIGAIVVHGMYPDVMKSSEHPIGQDGTEAPARNAFCNRDFRRHDRRLHFAVLRDIPVPDHFFRDGIEFPGFCRDARCLSHGHCGRCTNCGAGL